MPILGPMPEERPITGQHTLFLQEQSGLCECAEVQHPTAQKQQALVMVLDNHEFSTSQWWRFVADNTINFRLGCQIQNRVGKKMWLHQCHHCICEVAPALNLTQNQGWTKKNFPVAYTSTLQSKVIFYPSKTGFPTSPLKYITPKPC